MPSKAAVPIQSDNQGAREQQAITIFPTLIERTERQVEMLMTIIDGLDNHCFKAPEGSTGWQDCPPELAKAAISTSVSALAQLDNIIDDMSRWDGSGGLLEQSYGRYLETAARLSEAHMFNVSQSTLPHVRYGATVLRVDVNDWIAVLGAGTNKEVLGRGPTVHDALRDFDKKFLQGFDPKAEVLSVEPPKAKPVKKSSKTKSKP